jgi:hypothetical protein
MVQAGVHCDLHWCGGSAVTRVPDGPVLGRAARSGWGSALYDSVGNDLAGPAPCPIVFIPSRPPPV